MKQRGDWIAWVLQFLLGAFIGGLAGINLAYGRRLRRFIDEPYPLLFALGAALLVGGLAALKGDRLWLGGSRHGWRLDGPPHDRLTHAAAIGTILLGISMVLAAFVL